VVEVTQDVDKRDDPRLPMARQPGTSARRRADACGSSASSRSPTRGTTRSSPPSTCGPAPARHCPSRSSRRLWRRSRWVYAQPCRVI